MPTITIDGREITVESGVNLRDALIDADATPHNGAAKYLNCRGRGACGTCAVEVVAGTPGPKSTDELRRLDSPPFDEDTSLRLACQITVEDDLTVVKHDGFFGHKQPKEE